MFGTFFSALLISLVVGGVFGWVAFSITFVACLIAAWVIEAFRPGTFT